MIGGNIILPILDKFVNETRENKNGKKKKKYNDVSKLLTRDLDLLLKFDETWNMAYKMTKDVRRFFKGNASTEHTQEK